MHKASVEERLKLKRIQIDTWSTREQLCLASSVLRSGDQNWVSVSRAVKVLGDQGRPHDWFSQKNCALQYDSLLENAGTPKRKRGEKGEEAKPTTPGECIVQKLTMERIDELKRLLAQEKERYRKLKEDVIELSSGRADHRLGEISQQIEEEKKQKELEQIAHERRLKEREEKINEIQRAFRPQSYLIQRKAAVPVRPPGPVDMPVNSDTEMSQDSPLTDSPNVEPVLPEETPIKTEEKPASTPTSPLLTSLLKSPSPAPTAQASILHSAITAQRVPVASTASATPTISSLLAASPAKREGAVASAPASSFSPGLSHLVTSAISSGAAEVTQAPEDQARAQTMPSTSPSAGAPTLSMLLELPPSVPGTPLPELPVQTLASGATEEELLVADQIQQQIKTEVVQTESIPCQKDGIMVAQNILQTGPTLPIGAVANVLPVNTAQTGQLLELKPKAPVSIPEQQQLVPVPQIPLISQLPAEDTTVDTQLDKIVTEMKAEERPTTQVESVLEELPQDVVSLIEEVEMAEEAQKQLQQQQQPQPTPVPPKEQPQPDDVKLKIQEIQKQLVASTPEVVEVAPEPEVVPEEPVADVETATELPTITEEAEEPKPPVEIQKELQPEPQEEEEAVEDEVQEVQTEEEEKPVEPTVELQEPVPSEPVIETSEISEAEETKEELEEQEKVDEVEPETTVAAESIPDEVEISPESQDVTEEESEVQAEEQVTAETVSKEDEDVEEKEAVPLSPKQPVIQIIEEVAVEQEVEQEAEEEEDEEEAPPQQQQTLSTPVTTRRRHAPPASTPSTPIDSLPNSPASVGISATDEDREYRAWKKTILPLWSQLAAHKNASIFTRPITNEMAPGYHNVVFRPMDLTTIKKNIETGQIRSTLEFQRDLMLMFTNAIMYNASNHEVPKMAQEMQKDCLNTLQFLTAHEPAGIVGPFRRERRETHKRHDSSYQGDGDDSEASRSTAPSPLPLKRKRTTATVSTPAETKKRRSSIVP